MCFLQRSYRTKTGYFHILKKKCVKVSVDEKSIDNAVEVVKKAVRVILQEDYPMWI